jgi:hypothetical protein
MSEQYPGPLKKKRALLRIPRTLVNASGLLLPYLSSTLCWYGGRQAEGAQCNRPRRRRCLRRTGEQGLLAAGLCREGIRRDVMERQA